MDAPDFFVEDLLDLSNGGDEMTTTDTFFESASADSSAVTAVDSSNSSAVSFPFDSHFSSSLSLPYDEMAELEWLSNFVEESFSNDTFQKLQLNPNPIPNPNPNPNPASSVPAKARSKRSRVAPCDWSTRLLMVAPHTPSPSPATSSSSSATTSAHKKTPSKRRDGTDNSSPNGEVRRCLHCATEKTPQWRTGPMGPKTLCNACGVRYKSGRLVAEYRPASSPTFVSAKHSNSHRKVVELRRQKEVQRHQQQQQFMHHHHQQQHQQSMMMASGVSNGGDDFLIHHHHQMGHDYRQII